MRHTGETEKRRKTSKQRCVLIPQIPVLDTNFQKLFVNKNASFFVTVPVRLGSIRGVAGSGRIIVGRVGFF